MRITFDPTKNARNIAERGLSFARVADFDWETALAREDTRKDYGERRLSIFGRISGRLHVAIVTLRDDAMHVISFRKANSREVKRYEEAQERSGVAS